MPKNQKIETSPYRKGPTMKPGTMKHDSEKSKMGPSALSKTHRSDAASKVQDSIRSSRVNNASPAKLEASTSRNKFQKPQDIKTEDNYTDVADSAFKEKQQATSSNPYTAESAVQNRENLNASSSVPKASEQDSAVRIEDTKQTPEKAVTAGSKPPTTNKTGDPSVSLRNSLQKQATQLNRTIDGNNTGGGKSSRLSGHMMNSLGQNDSFEKPVKTTRNTETKNLADNEAARKHPSQPPNRFKSNAPIDTSKVSETRQVLSSKTKTRMGHSLGGGAPTGQFSTIGAGIIHGPNFLNIYNNPVVHFTKKRSTSRNGGMRKQKKIRTVIRDDEFATGSKLRKNIPGFGQVPPGKTAVSYQNVTAMTGVSDQQNDNRTYTKSPQNSMSIFQPGTTMTTMMQ